MSFLDKFFKKSSNQYDFLNINLGNIKLINGDNTKFNIAEFDGIKLLNIIPTLNNELYYKQTLFFLNGINKEVYNNGT